jgi:hypothetical protein
MDKKSRTPAALELRELVEAYQAILERLQPGDGTALALPESAYIRREVYRRVAGVCHKIWGPGMYRVRASPTHAAI